MGIDNILDIISSRLDIEINKYDNIYFTISKPGKVIFFTGYTCTNDIYNFMDMIDIDEFYERFSNNFSKKDKEKYISLKAFLWDLYIIAINCGEKDCINKIDKSNIERNRFLARKIIIDNIDKDKIDFINKLHEYDKENKSIAEAYITCLLEEIQMIIEPENQLDNLISSIDKEEESLEESIDILLEDEDLKNKVDELILDPNITSKQKLILYLEYIMNTENYYKEEV